MKYAFSIGPSELRVCTEIIERRISGASGQKPFGSPRLQRKFEGTLGPPFLCIPVYTSGYHQGLILIAINPRAVETGYSPLSQACRTFIRAPVNTLNPWKHHAQVLSPNALWLGLQKDIDHIFLTRYVPYRNTSNVSRSLASSASTISPMIGWVGCRGETSKCSENFVGTSNFSNRRKQVRGERERLNPSWTTHARPGWRGRTFSSSRSRRGRSDGSSRKYCSIGRNANPPYP